MRVIEQLRLVSVGPVRAEALLWPEAVIVPDETVYKGSDLSGPKPVAAHDKDHPNTG